MLMYVSALISSEDKETTDKILEQYQKKLSLAQESGSDVLSIGFDGEATKISAQATFLKLSKEFMIFDCDMENGHIRIPLIGVEKHPVL